MFYKAAVFDLDGTLLDTLADLGDSMNRVLKRHDLPVHDYEAYKYMIGDGIELLVKRALPESKNDPDTVSDFVKEYRDEYQLNWNKKTKPYDDINEMLDRLYSKGIELAVLSNKPHDFTELCVREFLPSNKFKIILGHRPGTNPKPDPAGAIEISEKLGISHEQILYLGDTGIDMKTAVSAGMFPVGVLWGFRKKDELIKHGAKILLNKPEDLLKFIE